MKTIILTMAFVLAFIDSGMAQREFYYTRNATLQVRGQFGNDLLFGVTKELGVKLDYETAQLDLKFNMNSLEVNVDAINTLLQKKFLEVSFTGKLGLESIITEGHPPLNFSVEGWLSAGHINVKIKGVGELYHVDDYGDYVCKLGIRIQLNLNDFNVEIPTGMNERIDVIITQALLERGKN